MNEHLRDYIINLIGFIAPVTSTAITVFDVVKEGMQLCTLLVGIGVGVSALVNNRVRNKKMKLDIEINELIKRKEIEEQQKQHEK